MIRKLVIGAVMVLGLFVMLEVSYRLVVVGPKALSPASASSFTTLMASKYIKPSEYPSVYYELKPNLDVMLRGVPLKTNSYGLPDKEYSLEKPGNTYRIAIVGSSWTMPASIPQEDSYQAQLENALNARSTGTNYEVINFGVEQYGVGEITATLEHRVFQFQPDVVIFAMTPFTSMIQWLDHEQAFQPPALDEPLFRSYVLLQLGIGKPPVNQSLAPPVLSGLTMKDFNTRRLQQISAALYKSHQLTEANDSKLVFLFLAHQPWFERTETLINSTLDRFGIPLVDGAKALAKIKINYKVSKVDTHPNAEGHKVIAEALLAHFETRLELQPN